MKVTNKKVIIIFSIIGVLFICNLIYYNIMRLKEPIFIKTYGEQFNGYDLRINYIKNINDNRKIDYITIPEYSDKKMSVVAYDNSIENYDICTMIIDCSPLKDYLEINKSKKVEVTKIKVKYNDGTRKVVNIGRAKINNRVFQDNEEDIYEKTNSEMKCIGRVEGKKTYFSKENITIEKIELSCLNLFDKFVKFKINGIDYKKLKYPLNIKRGEDIIFEYTNLNNNIEINSYKFFPLIYYKSRGKVKHFNMIIKYEPQIDENFIKELKKSEEGK